MFTLKFENEKGEILSLSGAESRYQIVEVDGLNPPNANIRMSDVAGMDGSKFTSANLGTRNIVLTVRINGDVERNRINLYNYFQTKHWSKMYYMNGIRDVYIEGYVETVECGLFSNSEEMQISIICPDPYFQSVDKIVSDISRVLNAFEFPFAFGAEGIIEGTITDEAIEFSTYIADRMTSIFNEGEDDTGVIINMTATGDVVNPIIYNASTRESFAINTTLQNGDVVTIDTNKGHKSIILTRGAVQSSLINKVAKGSKWLALSKGDNIFTYNADSGEANVKLVFSHRIKYQGV